MNGKNMVKCLVGGVICFYILGLITSFIGPLAGQIATAGFLFTWIVTIVLLFFNQVKDCSSEHLGETN